MVFAQKSADIKAVSEVVDNLFIAMQNKDAKAIKGLFVPGAQFAAVINPRNGKGDPRTRTNTVENFAQTISGVKGEIIERMPEKDVIFAENLALVLRSGTLPVKVKIIKEESNANSKDSK